MRCVAFIAVGLGSGFLLAQSEMPVEMAISPTDALVVDVRHEFYGIKDGASPLDRSAWIGPFGGANTYRVTIVRPFALCEFLRDEPDLGFVPVIESVTDRGYVSKHVRPVERTGAMAGVFTIYTVVEESVQAGTLKGNPLLQFLDLHMHDSTVPLLSIRRMVDEGMATLLSDDGAKASYQAYIEMRGYAANYDFEVNQRGTPLYAKTTLDLHENPELLPITYEQFTLSTRLVQDIEVPDEAIIVVENLNVQRERNLHHYRLTSAASQKGLVHADVRIEPALRSSTIHRYLPNGAVTSHHYDASGTLLRRQDVLSGPTPLPAETPKKSAAPPSTRAVTFILPLASLFVLVAAFATHFIARRSRVRRT